MNTLIIYASRYGCTRDCSEYLKNHLDGEVTLISIEEKIPNINKFDNIIIGGSVYMGKIQRSVLSFCKRNRDILMKKSTGFFICCYTPKETDKFIEKFFERDILNHARCIAIFGGEMRYEKMNILYRKLFSSLNRIEDYRKNFQEPKIDYDEIDSFAKIMNLSD